MAGVRNGAKTFTRIPAKWRDYAVCGKVIPGERLVSFKTPLSEEYHCKGNEVNPEDCLQKDEQFTPNDLCNVLKKKGRILGLVVDFTNTERYYKPKEFTDRKIKYEKIKCEGKIVPPEKVVNRFKASILSFFKESSDSTSVVGVHCTHGLNRAGYIVCRYLIECRGYSPQKAIDVFNAARGHKMERENYLEDLQQRKPKKLSEKDVEHLIETFQHDEEFQPSRYNLKRVHPDEYRQRRDTHAPYRPGYGGSKRHYSERFVQCREYWGEEVDYFDDRVDGHHVREASRNQRNERGHNMQSHADQEWFSRHDGRSRYENGPWYDSQNTFFRNGGSFRTERRRREVDDRKQYRDTEIYHAYDRGPSRINESDGSYREYYREREDRNTSRFRNRRPRGDYEPRQVFRNDTA